MSEDLNFHFPFADLLYNGNTILIAGEGDPAVSGRLPDNYVSDSRLLWKQLGGEDALKAQKKGDAGELTKEELIMLRRPQAKREEMSYRILQRRLKILSILTKIYAMLKPALCKWLTAVRRLRVAKIPNSRMAALISFRTLMERVL